MRERHTVHECTRYVACTEEKDVRNLVPRAFSSLKMAVEETPGQGCQSGSESSLEFRHANTMKCLRFV